MRFINNTIDLNLGPKSGPDSHSPCRLKGISGMPASSKLLYSGRTPVSKIPMIIIS